MRFPLPFRRHVTPPFRDHDDFPDLLRQVRDRIAADPESTRRRYLGARIFALVAGPYDARVTDVIDEYLDDSDPDEDRAVQRRQQRDTPGDAWRALP